VHGPEALTEPFLYFMEHPMEYGRAAAGGPVKLLPGSRKVRK